MLIFIHWLMQFRRPDISGGGGQHRQHILGTFSFAFMLGGVCAQLSNFNYSIKFGYVNFLELASQILIYTNCV
jgi:hypothetical protein